MGVVIKRTSFTPWEIVLSNGFDGDIEDERDFCICGEDRTWCEFDVCYRTGAKDGKECEIFSLLLKGVDYCVLQIYIFKTGDTVVWSMVPVQVQVEKRKHVVKVDMFSCCDVVNGELQVGSRTEFVFNSYKMSL